MEYFLALTVFLAPTYVIRFSLLGLPTNVLMLWLVVLWLVFIVQLVLKREVKRFIHDSFNIDRKLLIFIGLFLLAGIISLFVYGVSLEKLGELLVWFIQPIGTFFIAHYVLQNKPEKRAIIIETIYLFLLLVGIYAVAQYFTRFGLPSAWWGNSLEPKRALGFFEHPDGFSLFITPLLAFLLPDFFHRFKTWRANFLPILAWLIGAVGLLLSLSRGGWIGLFAAAVVYLIISANRKHIAGAAIAVAAIAIIVAAVPNLRYRLLLPFYGEKSSVARLSLWRTGASMIKASPITGKGLAGFDHNWYGYNRDPGLEHYNFPHNLFLNFWVDTGILGMVSFVLILVYGFLRGFRNRSNLYWFGLSLFLVALFVHGQIDSPYLKNDLAVIFWLVFGLVV